MTPSEDLKFHVVTTCSKLGYSQYGRRMLTSLNEYWPIDVGVSFYSEDVPGAIQLPQWLCEFKNAHGKSLRATGMASPGGPRTGRYNYRFDAVRFAHKTAAVIDAAEQALQNRSADVLVWVDADTVTHAPVSLPLLRSLAPKEGTAISWLWRTKTYPECGFYMLNLHAPTVPPLIERWKKLYVEGTLFDLTEWHDSYVLKTLVLSMGCPWVSLSGDAEDTSHPFINGPLGAVMDHLKGSRKTAGRSQARDLVKGPRNEAYWKGTK